MNVRDEKFRWERKGAFFDRDLKILLYFDFFGLFFFGAK